MDQPITSERKLTLSHAKRRRAGKKSAITRKINEIKDLIHERGSRSKIKYLNEILKSNLKEAIERHEELMLLIEEDDPDFDDEWINDLSLSVDSCIAETERYFLDRIDDPDSVESDTKSAVIQTVKEWRQKSFSIANSNTTYEDDRLVVEEDLESNKNNFMDQEVTDALSKLNLNSNENAFVKPNLNSNQKPDLNSGAMQLKRVRKLYKSDGDISRSKGLNVTTCYFPTYLSERGDEYLDNEKNWKELKKLQPNSNPPVIPNLNPQAKTYYQGIEVNNKQHETNEMVNLINSLPDDHSIFGEKTTCRPSKQTYEFDDVENVRPRSCIPKFHSTYTVTPKERFEQIKQIDQFDQHNQTTRKCQNIPGSRTTIKPNQYIGSPLEERNKTQQNRDDVLSHKESVDSWIDRLNPLKEEEIPGNTATVNITMQMLIQQRLPRLTIPSLELQNFGSTLLASSTTWYTNSHFLTHSRNTPI